MIIHQPETRRENGQFIVSARIEYSREYDQPNELWFSVDEKFAQLVSNRADIFLSTLIRVARIMREDIEIRGLLSPQLLYGMREYLKVHAAWSDNDDIININARSPIPTNRTSQQAAASCNMSGGIDSFYTLWSQLPENEPIEELQVKYGIHGIGFSSPHKHEFLKDVYVSQLAKTLESLKVKLLVVESNARNFGYPDPWLPITTGRIAIAQLFSPLITTHFAPSSDNYAYLKPLGSHPLTDHLFSTEHLRIFIHGSEFHRSQKLAQLKDWKPIQQLLQVCNQPFNDTYNDCTCKKCLRTMLGLEVLGVKKHFLTFPRPFHRRKLIGRVVRSDNMSADFIFLMRHAWTHKQKSIVPYILISMLIYKMTWWIKPLLGYKFK